MYLIRLGQMDVKGLLKAVGEADLLMQVMPLGYSLVIVSYHCCRSISHHFFRHTLPSIMPSDRGMLRLSMTSAHPFRY